MEILILVGLIVAQALFSAFRHHQLSGQVSSLAEKLSSNGVDTAKALVETCQNATRIAILPENTGTQLENLRLALNELSSSATKEITGLRNNVAATNTQVAATNVSVAAIRNDVADLVTRVEGLESEVEGINVRTGKLTANVTL